MLSMALVENVSAVLPVDWDNVVSSVDVTPQLLTTMAVLGAIILATVVGNAFVIAAVVLERNLRTHVANYLVASLAVADLMVAVLVMPVAAIKDVTSRWILGGMVCDAWISVDVMCCTASILHLVAISIDRYWAVTRVDYIHNRSKRRTMMMIALSWVVSIVISLPPLFLDNNVHLDDCFISQDLGYTVFSTAGAFYLPFFGMMIIYAKIYQVAKRRIRRKRYNKLAALNRRGLTADDRREVTGVLAPILVVSTFDDEAESYCELQVADANQPVRRRSYCRETEVTERADNRHDGRLTVVSDAWRHYDNSIQSSERLLPVTSSLSTIGSDEPLHVMEVGKTDTPEMTLLCTTKPTIRRTAIPLRSRDDLMVGTNAVDTQKDRNIQQSPSNFVNCRRHSMTSLTPNFVVNRSLDVTMMTGGKGPTRSRSFLDLTRQLISMGPLSRSADNVPSREHIELMRERKAARTLAIITGAFILCWLPFFVHAILRPFCGSRCRFPELVVSVIGWLGYINSLLNPVIYTVFNPDFRSAFSRILCGRYKTRSSRQSAFLK